MLPPEAYGAFLANKPGFAERVQALPLGDAAELEHACQALCEHMEHWPVPDTLRSEVAAALAQLGADNAFSVRSSATSEDMGGAAFAGQHDTYLNCIGTDEVFARIRDCWVSLWSPRAISYRLQAGIGLQESAMAVVVQKMAFNASPGSASASIP